MIMAGARGGPGALEPDRWLPVTGMGWWLGPAHQLVMIMAGARGGPGALEPDRWLPVAGARPPAGDDHGRGARGGPCTRTGSDYVM